MFSNSLLASSLAYFAAEQFSSSASFVDMAIEDGERKEFLAAIQKKKAMGPHIIPLDEENHVPPWLTPLLRASFFAHCTAHAESNKNECNLYCLDCTGDAICPSCLPYHRDHRIVQIRRSSYNNVIKVSEISEFMDISGVQTYVINSAKIVFLEERPQARPGKGVIYSCEICCRPLLESNCFCSIGCKLRWMCQDQMSKSSKRLVAAVKAEECGGESSNIKRAENSVESVSSHRRSRRKGIPRRATF